jgi:hypothetical protein
VNTQQACLVAVPVAAPYIASSRTGDCTCNDARLLYNSLVHAAQYDMRCESRIRAPTHCMACRWGGCCGRLVAGGCWVGSLWLGIARKNDSLVGCKRCSGRGGRWVARNGRGCLRAQQVRESSSCCLLFALLCLSIHYSRFPRISLRPSPRPSIPCSVCRRSLTSEAVSDAARRRAFQKLAVDRRGCHWFRRSTLPSYRSITQSSRAQHSLLRGLYE